MTGEDVGERGEVLVVGDDAAEVWVAGEAQRAVATNDGRHVVRR